MTARAALTAARPAAAANGHQPAQREGPQHGPHTSAPDQVRARAASSTAPPSEARAARRPKAARGQRAATVPRAKAKEHQRRTLHLQH